MNVADVDRTQRESFSAFRAEADARREQNQNQAEEQRLKDLMRHQRKLENARRRSVRHTRALGE